MRKSLRIFLVAAATLTLGITLVASSAANTPSAPTRPSWVNANGRVDVARMPARIPVLNAEGATIGYVDSKAMMAGPDDTSQDGFPIYADITSNVIVGTLPPSDRGIKVGTPTRPATRTP